MDALEVDIRAKTTFGDEFGGRSTQPGRAEIAGRFDQGLLDQGLAGLDKQLFAVGVTDLHGGAILGFGVLVEILAGEGGPAKPVTAGRVPEEHKLVARLLGLGGDDPLIVGEADASDVDKWVSFVIGVKVDAPGDCRHADRVAVVADPLNNTLEEILSVFAVKITKIEAVGQGDRIGTHRERISDDTADAGRRAVVGIDVARVIVALDAERDVCLAVVVWIAFGGRRVGRVGVGDGDNGGVVAGADNNLIAFAVERVEQRPRGAVGAVLAPEILEKGRLGGRWLATEFSGDKFVVGIREAHLALPFEPPA